MTKTEGPRLPIGATPHDVKNTFIANDENGAFSVVAGVDIFYTGPRNNLDVKVGSSPDNLVRLKDLTPETIRFEMADSEPDPTKFGKVVTDIYGPPGIRMPWQDKHKDALVYGLLHGISRVKKHRDPAWHKLSVDANMGLHGVLFVFRLNGYVDKGRFAKDYDSRVKQLEQIRILCQEERDVSIGALNQLRDLLSQGINLVPHIKTFKDLTNLVNSRKILRTGGQIDIDPKIFEKIFGYDMTLTQDEVANIMSGYPLGMPRPFR